MGWGVGAGQEADQSSPSPLHEARRRLRASSDCTRPSSSSASWPRGAGRGQTQRPSLQPSPHVAGQEPGLPAARGQGSSPTIVRCHMRLEMRPARMEWRFAPRPHPSPPGTPTCSPARPPRPASAPPPRGPCPAAGNPPSTYLYSRHPPHSSPSLFSYSYHFMAAAGPIRIPPREAVVCTGCILGQTRGAAPGRHGHSWPRHSETLATMRRSSSFSACGNVSYKSCAFHGSADTL